MKKLLFICIIALNVVGLSFLALSQSVNGFSVIMALAEGENPPPPKYQDDDVTDCSEIDPQIYYRGEYCFQIKTIKNQNLCKDSDFPTCCNPWDCKATGEEEEVPC